MAPEWRLLPGRVEEWRALTGRLEEWRALAGRVPEILEPIRAVDEGSMNSRLPKLLNDAYNALRLLRDNLRTFRRLPYVLDPLQQPVLPCMLLARAITLLGQHHELHFAGARFLALYGERLGFLRPTSTTQRDFVFCPGQDQMANANPWWKDWFNNRLEAFDSKRELSRRLRLAAAYDRAILDTVCVAQMLPAGSAYREAWIKTAESLAMDAEVQTSEAFNHAHRMRGAVVSESEDATLILDCT